MSHDAKTLREQAYKLEAIRTWLQRIEGARPTCALADLANRMESEILTIEDGIAAVADRLDPPPTRYTGQQWLAGLTRRVGQ